MWGLAFFQKRKFLQLPPSIFSAKRSFFFSLQPVFGVGIDAKKGEIKSEAELEILDLKEGLDTLRAWTPGMLLPLPLPSGPRVCPLVNHKRFRTPYSFCLD